MKKIELNTHDNGGRPFRIIIAGNSAIVYKLDENEPDKYEIAIPLLSINNFDKMFIGMDKFDRIFSYGNSILVKIDSSSKITKMPNKLLKMIIADKNNYIFIGDSIFNFATDDEIIGYDSTIGNNDVIYPYATGIKNTYLMEEQKYIVNNVMTDNDPYEQVYRDPNTIAFKFKINTLIKRKL